jgi:pimeloyl-ACP methyl ester carboxylesterase
VSESQALPRPVAVYTNGVKTLYTHWMDYAARNPKFDGYAYDFWVGVPSTGNPSPLPLQMHLHAYGESWQRNWTEGDPYGAGTPFDLPAVWIEPDDNRNTWWYGYPDNTAKGEDANGSSVIVNYTEQRLLYLIRWITSSSSPYQIDANRIYLYGGSMGGSGTLSFGLRHPEIFAALYAIVPMTDYGASTWGRAGLDSLWGTVDMNLPTNEGIGVYDRQNTRQYLIDHAAGPLPYTVTFHGRNDTIIEWSSQGLPWVQAHDPAQAPGPEMWANSDHSNSFDVYLKSPFANYPMTSYSLRHDESYLVFTAAPGDDDPGAAIPSCRGVDPYAYGFLGNSVEFASSALPFMGRSAPIDTPSTWETALRIRTDECGWPASGTVTVTLHNPRAFRPASGTIVQWQLYDASGTSVRSGSVTVPANGLVTVTGVPVTTSGGVFTLTSGGGGTPGDADSDGITVAQGDCDDNDPAIHPGALETCDGKDNDCDGQIDDGLETFTWYQDQDLDGYGSSSIIEACAEPAGYVDRGGTAMMTK